jgi:hypothetical protein
MRGLDERRPGGPVRRADLARAGEVAQEATDASHRKERLWESMLVEPITAASSATSVFACIIEASYSHTRTPPARRRP